MLSFNFVVALYSMYSLYAITKVVLLMKEVVMCNKNLRHKSLLKVNRPLELWKHRNFDFDLFGEGMTAILI